MASNFYGKKLGYKQMLYRKYEIPSTSGIYMFRRNITLGEVDSCGNKKDYISEIYIGQAKDLLDRCASHLLEHNHLGISLKKYGIGRDQYSWTILYYPRALGELNNAEKKIIEMYSKDKIYKLLNISGGGQAQERTTHLENNDLTKKLIHKRNSVEQRALNKNKKFIEDLLKVEKYFKITLEPKDNAYLKNGSGANINGIKAQEKFWKLLGKGELDV